MDRRACRLTSELLAQLLDIPGNIIHVTFNHKTNMIDIYFTGNGSHQCAEGCETVRKSIADWHQWDKIYSEQLEEELIEKWEKD